MRIERKGGSSRAGAVKSSEAAEKDELAKWQGAVVEEGVGGSGQSNSSCLGPSFIFTLIKVNGKQRTPAGWMRGRRRGVGRQVGVAAWLPGCLAGPTFAQQILLASPKEL